MGLDINIKGLSTEAILEKLLREYYSAEQTSAIVAVVQTHNAELLNLSLRGLSANIAAASNDSSNLGKKILYLTLALVAVGLVQALATAWPYLAWWLHH
jgi:hypothetical protein